MIRTRQGHAWTVQTKDGNGRWRDHLNVHRCSVAMREFLSLTCEKRLLLDGYPVRMHTDDDELDLFNELG